MINNSRLAAHNNDTQSDGERQRSQPAINLEQALHGSW